MVHYLYHFDYDVRLQHERCHFDESEINGDVADIKEPIGDILVTHAKVYAFTEKYLIRGLKAVALRQFTAATTVSLDINDFLQATREVYTSTIEDDRGLRDVVVETLYKHSQWLDKEEVRAVLKGLGALTYDLVLYMRQHGRF
jgi:cyanate lyase